jgi:NAD(P)H-hydrate repair Nnr-like enzyme with NAD(P)H-hydrate dehydratase domain
MLGRSTAEVQQDRLSAVRSLRERFGAIAVLKGCRTLVASGGGITINGTGNPFLAQGGSGDVLAGYLAGLLAQPALAMAAERTVRFGIRQHGLAADRLAEERHAWDLDDLLGRLGNARECH